MPILGNQRKRPLSLHPRLLSALAGKPRVILNVSSSVSDMVSPNLSSYATTKMAVNRSVQHPCIRLYLHLIPETCRFTEAIHLGEIPSHQPKELSKVEIATKTSRECPAWCSLHCIPPGGIAETGMGQTAPPQFRSRLYDTGWTILIDLLLHQSLIIILVIQSTSLAAPPSISPQNLHPSCPADLSFRIGTWSRSRS